MKTVKISSSALSTAFLAIFTLLILFSPDAKGWLIGGLMKAGLFQPDVKDQQLPETSIASLSAVRLKDAAGNTVHLSKLKGKVIFINFWATWCPPCRAEMPSIESLYRNMKDNKGIIFLMVDVDNNYRKAKQYMDRKKFSLPVYTLLSPVPETLFSGSLPTTVIFNKQGRVVFKHEGAADFTNKQIIAYLHELSK